MDKIFFTYREGKPVDYRAFAQWLFYLTPNLKRDPANCRIPVKTVIMAIEISLDVSSEVAWKLVTNAIRLGFIKEEHACDVVHGRLKHDNCCFSPDVEKP